MARSYYCLIAGLPDLGLDESKLSITLSAYKELLADSLHPKDMEKVNVLFFPFDHLNIINKLHKQDKPFDERGFYAETYVEELCNRLTYELADGAKLPTYLRSFFSTIHQQSDEVSLINDEYQLAKGYFELLLNADNKLLKAYAGFEQTLRNSVIALNGRRFDIDVENEFIGDDEVTQAIKKNKARDFGLNAEVPYIEKLVYIYESNSVLDREMKLDLLRWEFLEELTVFEYFSLEKVLAFTIKLLIVERWFKLDVEKGQQLLTLLLQDLKSGYDFPEEFKIGHGKKN